MMKPSFNRDFKIPMKTTSVHTRKLQLPAFLIGTIILLATVFYFKSATSNAPADDYKPTTLSNVISIDLPSKSADTLPTPTIEKNSNNTISRALFRALRLKTKHLGKTTQ